MLDIDSNTIDHPRKEGIDDFAFEEQRETNRKSAEDTTHENTNSTIKEGINQFTGKDQSKSKGYFTEDTAYEKDNHTTKDVIDPFEIFEQTQTKRSTEETVYDDDDFSTFTGQTTLDSTNLTIKQCTNQINVEYQPQTKQYFTEDTADEKANHTIKRVFQFYTIEEQSQLKRSTEETVDEDDEISVFTGQSTLDSTNNAIKENTNQLTVGNQSESKRHFTEDITDENANHTTKEVIKSFSSEEQPNTERKSTEETDDESDEALIFAFAGETTVKKTNSTIKEGINQFTDEDTADENTNHTTKEVIKPFAPEEQSQIEQQSTVETENEDDDFSGIFSNDSILNEEHSQVTQKVTKDTDEHHRKISEISIKPTPADKLIELQVQMLLDEKISMAGKILDVLIQLNLLDPDNNEALKAFENTKICQNICKVISQSNDVRGKIQAKACEFAFHLTWSRNIDKSHNYFVRRFIANNSIGIISDLLKQFPTNTLIQESGCGVLANLAYSVKSNQNDAISLTKKFECSNCFETLYVSMREFPNNPTLLFNVVSILCDLIVEDPKHSMSDPTEKVTFIAPILDLLGHYYGDPFQVDLITKSLYFLWKVAIRYQKTLRVVIRGKGGTVILAEVEDYYKKQSKNVVSALAGSILMLMY